MICGRLSPSTRQPFKRNISFYCSTSLSLKHFVDSSLSWLSPIHHGVNDINSTLTRWSSTSCHHSGWRTGMTYFVNYLETPRRNISVLLEFIFSTFLLFFNFCIYRISLAVSDSLIFLMRGFQNFLLQSEHIASPWI